MDSIVVMLSFIAASLAVGALLYLPVRWYVRRRAPAPGKGLAVQPAQLAMAVLVVGCLLVLVWFVESGSRAAAIAYAATLLIASVAAIKIVKRTAETDEQDDA